MIKKLKELFNFYTNPKQVIVEGINEAAKENLGEDFVQRAAPVVEAASKGQLPSVEHVSEMLVAGRDSILEKFKKAAMGGFQTYVGGPTFDLMNKVISLKNDVVSYFTGEAPKADDKDAKEKTSGFVANILGKIGAPIINTFFMILDLLFRAFSWIWNMVSGGAVKKEAAQNPANEADANANPAPAAAPAAPAPDAPAPAAAPAAAANDADKKAKADEPSVLQRAARGFFNMFKRTPKPAPAQANANDEQPEPKDRPAPGK